MGILRSHLLTVCHIQDIGLQGLIIWLTFKHSKSFLLHFQFSGCKIMPSLKFREMFGKIILFLFPFFPALKAKYVHLQVNGLKAGEVEQKMLLSIVTSLL